MSAAGRRESAAARTTRRVRCGCSRRAGSILARCADADRRFLLPRLAALGIPIRAARRRDDVGVLLHLRRRRADDERGRDRRHVDAARRVARRPARALDPRRAAPPLGLPGGDGRRARARPDGCCSTGRGSSAARSSGRCSSTPTSIRAVLEHVSILKLAEEEAAVLGGVEARRAGDRRHARLARVDRLRARASRRTSRRVRCRATRPARATRSRRRTSSGRAAGHAPAAAARRATAVVGATLRMKALVQTAMGVFAVDLDTEELEPADMPLGLSGSEPLKSRAAARRRRRGVRLDGRRRRRPQAAADALARRRHHLAGGGRRLAAGFRGRDRRDDPDVVVYASRNRLHLSDEWRRVLAGPGRRAARDRGGVAGDLVAQSHKVTGAGTRRARRRRRTRRPRRARSSPAFPPRARTGATAA